MSRAPRAEPPELDAVAIISILNRHDVRYVVIGAFAAIAQQAPIPATRDIDLTPEATPKNLGRLSTALEELRARIRTKDEAEGLPFAHDAASLGAVETWNLVSPHGEFDISFYPSGIEQGYSELSMRSHKVQIEGVEVEIAHLDDVIRSKEAAGRPKDLQVLPILYRHRATRRD